MSLLDQVKQLVDKHGWSFTQHAHPNENVLQFHIFVPSQTSDRKYEVRVYSNPWTPFVAVLVTGINAFEWSGLFSELTSLIRDLPQLIQCGVGEQHGIAMQNANPDGLEDYITTAVKGADRLHNAIDLARLAVNSYRSELIKPHDGQPGNLI